ncbi:MAG: hypothetical protein LBK40_05130 [Spirochaetaceae bacterium]|jgi:hypothetical protein|nr:hypothetical protein [Spirochaetaceae bacterium]
MKSPLIAFTILLFLGSCASVDTEKNVPPLTVAAYQQTVYNGMPQPIEVPRTDRGPLEIRYFSAGEEPDGEGSEDPPIAAGVYYVRVRQPGDDSGLMVEYHIGKAPVTIIAEPVQEAVYNGSPKSVAARSEPSLGLNAVYYPTREAREAAAGSSAAPDVRGYTRVERAPIEPGTYYVTVYYSGDANYQYTKFDIELIIHPAARRPERQ